MEIGLRVPDSMPSRVAILSSKRLMSAPVSRSAAVMSERPVSGEPYTNGDSRFGRVEEFELEV
jgi:hypothetical protein